MKKRILLFFVALLVCKIGQAAEVSSDIAYISKKEDKLVVNQWGAIRFVINVWNDETKSFEEDLCPHTTTTWESKFIIKKLRQPGSVYYNHLYIAFHGALYTDKPVVIHYDDETCWVSGITFVDIPVRTW